MSARIRQHIRSNVVGYVAVFIALSGTAYAVDGPLPGQNQVGSADIINNEVQSADIKDANLTTADIRADAVTTGKILDGEVRSGDVLDNTLTGTDVNESTLSGVNADQLDGIDSTGFARGSIQAVDFRANANTPFTTILNLGGLSMIAACEASKDLRMMFSSDVDNASMRMTYSQFGDAVAHTDFSNDVDTGFSYESQFSMGTDDDTVGGTFVYSKPAGGSVSVAFQAEDSEGSAGADAFGGTHDCMFTGTATKTP